MIGGGIRATKRIQLPHARQVVVHLHQYRVVVTILLDWLRGPRNCTFIGIGVVIMGLILFRITKCDLGGGF